MGYELDWDEARRRWGVWNTVVCDFVGYASTPEGVAGIITEGREFCFCPPSPEEKARRVSLRAELARLEREAVTRERPWAVISKQMESVKAELQRLEKITERPMICAYYPGLAPELKPDPKAREKVRHLWIEEANKAREEKRRVTLVCEITPEMLQKKKPKWVSPKQEG